MQLTESVIKNRERKIDPRKKQRQNKTDNRNK